MNSKTLKNLNSGLRNYWLDKYPLLSIITISEIDQIFKILWPDNFDINKLKDIDWDHDYIKIAITQTISTSLKYAALHYKFIVKYNLDLSIQKFSNIINNIPVIDHGIYYLNIKKSQVVTIDDIEWISSITQKINIKEEEIKKYCNMYNLSFIILLLGNGKKIILNPCEAHHRDKLESFFIYEIKDNSGVVYSCNNKTITKFDNKPSLYMRPGTKLFDAHGNIEVYFITEKNTFTVHAKYGRFLNIRYINNKYEYDTNHGKYADINEAIINAKEILNNQIKNLF
jgi:hypothetical protein